MERTFSIILRLCLLGCLIFSSFSSQPASTASINLSSQATTRTGAWLDSVVIRSEDDFSAALNQLEAGTLDIYAYSSANPGLYQTIQNNPNLVSSSSQGSYFELTLNPAGPVFNNGKLNPFAVPAIREALNWLVDRSAITLQIMGGLGVAKYFPIMVSYPDYVRYQAKVQELESLYAYNPAQASAVINAEMAKLGATRVGGKWYYNAAPVTLIFVIRVEDERLQIGDYIASQLESVGFTVERQYKTRAQASPIWFQSNPADGLWHLYTGGWISPAIDPDEATNFGYFYTPLGSSSPLWSAYQPSPQFMNAAEKLWNNDFASPAERDILFNQALELALKDSARVWLAEATAFTPRRSNVAIATDLAGGLLGSRLWAYTARFTGVEGGLMQAAVPGFHIAPWNPIAGSNWAFDRFIQNATQDDATLPDPKNGLPHLQRLASAAVTAQNGLPVTRTLDWVSLSFAPAITVPGDAWVDWDAANQRFLTAAEVYGAPLTAQAKSVAVYPADLFTTVKWHDGSALSPADFVMRMILTFDRAKRESAIFDVSAAPQFEAFMTTFKGVKIISTNPLIIETYKDNFQLDAELMVEDWWPDYGYGEGAWHNLAVGYLAEAAHTLAFSPRKADAMGIPWMDFISGNSLGALWGYLTTARATGYVPYQTALSPFLASGEAAARWDNLYAWAESKGHFWLGTGPFYLASAYNPALGALTLLYNPYHPDPAGKWDRFNHNPLPPTLQLNYSDGAPGSAFNLVGENFPFNRVGTISVNGYKQGTMFIGESGAFTMTLTTSPQANEGIYITTVKVNPTLQTRFELSAGSPLRSRSGSYPTLELPAGLAAFKVFLNLPILRR